MLFYFFPTNNETNIFFSQLLVSYVLATSGALTTALSLNRLTKVCIQFILNRTNVQIYSFIHTIETQSIGWPISSVGCSGCGKLHKHSSNAKSVSHSVTSKLQFPILCKDIKKIQEFSSNLKISTHPMEISWITHQILLCKISVNCRKVFR